MYKKWTGFSYFLVLLEIKKIMVNPPLTKETDFEIMKKTKVNHNEKYLLGSIKTKNSPGERNCSYKIANETNRLKDEARILKYREAILDNRKLFEDKVNFRKDKLRNFEHK